MTERSYRKTTKGLNRWRRQEIGGTRLNTLHDSAEASVSKVIEFLEKKSERILEENEFTKEGRTDDNCQAVVQASAHQPAQFEQDKVKQALVSVGVEMQKRGLAFEIVEEVNEKSLEKTYEKPVDTVNIHIDKVGVKKQKEQRRIKKNDNEAEVFDTTNTKNKRPLVPNTVARIVYSEKRFYLDRR